MLMFIAEDLVQAKDTKIIRNLILWLLSTHLFIHTLGLAFLESGVSMNWLIVYGHYNAQEPISVQYSKGVWSACVLE